MDPSLSHESARKGLQLHPKRIYSINCVTEYFMAENYSEEENDSSENTKITSLQMMAAGEDEDDMRKPSIYFHNISMKDKKKTKSFR